MEKVPTWTSQVIDISQLTQTHSKLCKNASQTVWAELWKQKLLSQVSLPSAHSGPHSQG